MIDIEARKEVMLKELDKLEHDLSILAGRILKAREDLVNVTNEEEAIQYDETHDLEDGLNIIRLF